MVAVRVSPSSRSSSSASRAARQDALAAQRDQAAEQRRGHALAGGRHAQDAEELPRLQAQLDRQLAQRGLQRRLVEGQLGQDAARGFQRGQRLRRRSAPWRPASAGRS